MSSASIDNPILNRPYDPPGRHFVIGSNGITGEIATGRRLSESYVPVPPARKSKRAQEALDFDTTGERRDINTLINDIRRDVELWRGRGYTGVTEDVRKSVELRVVIPVFQAAV